MTPGNKNSYNSLKKISIDNKEYNYYSLSEAEKNGLDGINKLPKSLKVLLENLLRYEDDLSVTKSQIEAIKNWLETKKSKTEIAYRPARVLLQDYTGIPAVADLAAMREAVKEKNKVGFDSKINQIVSMSSYGVNARKSLLHLFKWRK
jgi:aconitate hydratase